MSENAPKGIRIAKVSLHDAGILITGAIRNKYGNGLKEYGWQRMHVSILEGELTKDDENESIQASKKGDGEKVFYVQKREHELASEEIDKAFCFPIKIIFSEGEYDGHLRICIGRVWQIERKDLDNSSEENVIVKKISCIHRVPKFTTLRIQISEVLY